MMLWLACALRGTTLGMTGSPYRRNRAAFPWTKVLISQRFGTSARKGENGFVRRQIVSSQRAGRNIRDEKASNFNVRKIRGGNWRVRNESRAFAFAAASISTVVLDKRA